MTATPVILVGDIALAAQGSWAPLAWSVPEFVVACMWMVVAANDATPKLGMAPPVLAAGMFAHAIASMTLYNEPGVSTHTRSTTPRRPTIRRWQFAPTVARRAVMLSATRAF